MAGNQVGELVIGLKFDGKNLTASLNGIERQVEKTGTTSGSRFGQAMVFAMGNLIAKGVSKIAGLITDNFDSAVRRLDTLNNFPRVMENMGISAQKSQKAINRISEGLKGLPTALDAGARSVQRLTSVNGDINKSTKYFLAMNNAIIAGGTSAEQQQNAIEQLSQAYSKGRMDMMEWRTLQMAMPAQLNQVAKAMGLTTDALGEGLRKGDISMEQFMQTITRLNEKGVAGFASFEEQARGATGGIQTSIANMNTAVARGITKILEAIGSENIANYFAQTGEKIEAMATAMAGAIKWIQANSEELKIFGSVVAGVGSALVTANIAGEVNTIWQVMKLGGGISGFTSNLAQLPGTLGRVGMALSNTGKGFGSLFSILKAHPILAIVSAIVGALAVFFTQTKTGQKVMKKLMSVVSSVFGKIASAIGPTLERIGNTLSDVFSRIRPLMGEMFNKLADIFAKVVKYMTPVIEQLFPMLQPIGKAIVNLVLALMSPVSELIQALLPIITAIIPVLADFIKAVLPTVVQVLQTIMPPLVTILSIIANIFAIVLMVVAKVISFVLPIIVNVITTIIKVIVGIINIVMSVITAIITGVTRVIQFVTSVITGIVGFVSGAINKIAGFFRGLWNTIKSIFSGVGNFFRGVFDTIRSIFQNIAQKIGNTIGGIIRGAINGILTIAENIINGPIRALNGMIDIINNIPGVSVGKLKEWRLPRMATGGVVNNATTAVIGEAGREAVLPLDRNTQWASILADKLVDELESDEVGFGRPIQVTINNKIDNKLDAQEIGNIMMTSIRRAV